MRPQFRKALFPLSKHQAQLFHRAVSIYFVFNGLLEDGVEEAIGFEYFKLARSVLKIGSLEFINLQYFSSTFMNLKIARLAVLNAKCEIGVFTQCSRQ